ncbi:MAG TPA: hypothetical protein VHB25_10700 [Gemmatimonadaceae bacterium]|nr:hypothetical protein [Gemmatimonadaceae bacterium]
MPQFLIAGHLPGAFEASTQGEATGQGMHALVRRAAVVTLALLASLGAVREASAQAAGAAYTKMAPVELYLMPDREAEVALARAAAPDSIARNAEVMVLGHHGFEKAVDGTNGFVCIVARSWTASPDFWNPKVRVPMCFNAPAARSYLVRVMKESGWVLAGEKQPQLNQTIARGVATKELPPMEPGAMCYMIAKEGYAGDGVPHWPPHLMFFFSNVDPALWGANVPNSPVVAVADSLEHLTSFVIVAQHWSDGSAYRPDSPGHVHR